MNLVQLVAYYLNPVMTYFEVYVVFVISTVTTFFVLAAIVEFFWPGEL